LGVFVVKDIESRQTNVGDFFLIESNCRVRRQSIAGRTNGCPGRAARQRQRPSDSQYRYSFRPTLSLRSSLAMRHGGGLLFTAAPSSISTARLVAYRFNKSGSLAMLAAMRRASSRAGNCQRRLLSIDGVFGTRTGTLIPYQVKFRSQRAYLTYTENRPILG
jgi:hypothetical protein